MKYRSRTEIVSAMLSTTNGSGTTKTKIMYKAFLSYSQLKEYLSILVQNGLLSFDSVSQTYKTTPKGLKFLQLSEQLGGMFGISENRDKQWYALIETTT